MQCTNRVLMVRPVRFAYNEETAVNNVFQEKTENGDINLIAQKEFDTYVQMLRDGGIDVVVVDDTPEPHTPDSIFPNNWMSTHKESELYGSQAENPDGTVLILYPMNAQNRRNERKKNVVPTLMGLADLNITRIIDLSDFELDGKFLEGTGSMILDRDNKIAYCCRSVRTNEEVLKVWAEKTGYKYILFDAVDANGYPIYHTNVMMCVGQRYVFVCMSAIKSPADRSLLLEMFKRTNKEVIDITFEQVQQYAGNMLVLKDNNDNLVLALSSTAKDSLTQPQMETLLKHYKKIVSPELECIQKNGGGSARCMLAEIF